MGLMTKMRENTKYVLYFVVVAFGILFMLQDAGTFDTVGTNTATEIIMVNGEPISYEQYRNVLDNQTRIYQNRTGESMTQQALDNARDQVYNQLVDGILIEQEMDRLGIKVTDGELVDLVLGDDPHPMVVSTFSDATGNLDRTLLQSFIDDPTASQQWSMLESQLRDTRRREKLQKLVEATVRVSDEDVLEEHRKTNLKIDTRFVALRYATVPDDSITFGDSDLRQYYNANKEDFKRKKSYTLNYVSIPKLPTATDTLAILDEMNQLKTRFAEAEDDSLFLARYASARPYASAFFVADDLDYDLSVSVYDDLTPERIIGPMVVGNEIRLIKIQESKTGEDELLRGRHILFRITDRTDEGKRKTEQEARDVKRRIEAGEDFATLAKLFSTDNSNASRGGDLGWFGRGKMVEAFENAAFAARTGRIVGPVETQFGFHLIEVTDRTREQVRLADYAQLIEPSVGTINAIAERLSDLEYYASESDDFTGEAEKLNLEIKEVQVQSEQTYISGIGNSRLLRNFMESSGEGAISESIELDDAFVVAQLAEITPEGYRSFEEVKAEIEPRAKIEKKKAYQAAKMQKAFDTNGFDGLATALGTTERVVTAVTYNTRSVAELGSDPVFKGTVLSMGNDQTSTVVEGQNGVFVVRTTKVDAPAEITDVERTQLQTQLSTQLKQQATREWLASLRDRADIDDNRRFFSQ
ncbi:MAG: peptidylprolyl isomerase [Rhodothermales bacterium]